MLSIIGTPWSPDGERAGDVDIRVDLSEAVGDSGAHPPDIDPPFIPKIMRLTWEMFERFGLTAQCLGCRAIPTRIGYPANHTERCRERIEQELEKEPEGASKVARDRERIKRARDMRIEDPEQRPDREVIEETGASSSRDGAGNEQEDTERPVAMSESQPLPAEPSVGEEQPTREESDDANMADPDRESCSERKGKQRQSGSMSLLVKKVMNGSPSSQTSSVLSPRLSRADLS